MKVSGAIRRGSVDSYCLKLVYLSLSVFLTSGYAVNGSVVISGNLSSDNDVDRISVNVPIIEMVDNGGIPRLTKVMARTLSYAGGTAVDGTVVSSGGFDPMLGLFSSGGALVTSNDDSGGNADPTTGSSFDAKIESFVEGGTYKVSVSQYDNSPNSSFSGKSFGGSPFIDVNDDVRSSAYSVEILTLDSVLKDSFKTTSDPSGTPVIDATFQPNFNLSLEEAASFGGFDHFNFYQYITLDYSGIDVVSPIGGFVAVADYLFGRGDGVDPLPGGNTFNHTADYLPWYYDEGGVGDSPIEAVTSNGANLVFFSDAPNLVVKGTSMSAITLLAGVYSDGTGVVFPGIDGTSFKWTYTQNENWGSGSISDVTLRNSDSTLGGNGMIDFGGELTDSDWASLTGILQSQGLGIATSVPEPSRALLSLVGIAAVGLRRRRA